MQLHALSRCACLQHINWAAQDQLPLPLPPTAEAGPASGEGRPPHCSTLLGTGAGGADSAWSRCRGLRVSTGMGGAGMGGATAGSGTRATLGCQADADRV